ncbi:hypothetical protein PHMEG_00025042 [Phytophthora megakarya]|uniref:Uncharacterized protein n=1 Tax=Phytophthora megakarya TaxID=4795 RepID=A0A225VCM6_9STRA|nr:hypothetical protein PHMEG_00025042 [Phytophthora megakarya]
MWKPGTMIEMCIHRRLMSFEDPLTHEAKINELLNLLKENTPEILPDLADAIRNGLHANVC